MISERKRLEIIEMLNYIKKINNNGEIVENLFSIHLTNLALNNKYITYYLHNKELIFVVTADGDKLL